MSRQHSPTACRSARPPDDSERQTAPPALPLHHHLLEVCEPCRRAWEALGSDREDVRQLLRRLGTAAAAEGSAPADAAPPAAPPDSTLPPVDSAAGRDLEARVDRLRRQRQKVRREVAELLRTAAAERPAKVRAAHSRFRSRGWAELMLEESRGRVRTDPHEARSLAALVVEILEARCRRPAAPDWAPALLIRAQAHLANAERVAGDLPAATRRFAALHRRLASLPPACRPPRLLAEVLSLEASLHIGQRRFRDAEVVLTLAALLHRRADNRPALGRTLIKRANLSWTRGDTAAALTDLERAAAFLRDDGPSYLLLCTVTGRALALCDLERFAEADTLLRSHLPLVEGSDDLHTAASLRGLQGRVALGLGDLDAAEEAFGASRDAFLALGRHYDAALVSLDLAHALLAAGRRTPLRRLAVELLREFRARNVERETLAVLRLLGRAVAQDSLTVAVLHRLRRRLESAGPDRPLTTPPE